MVEKFIAKMNAQYVTETGYTSALVNAKTFDTAADALAAFVDLDESNVYQVLSIYKYVTP